MSTTDELTYEGVLEIWACWCGIRVGLPEELSRQVRHHRKTAYCPLGHSFVKAGKTDAEREKERRIAAEESERFYREQAAAERRSAAALRGHITRLKNRIVAGVCPVPGCKRSGFSNVMRHVASKHPEWHADHAHEVVDR